MSDHLSETEEHALREGWPCDYCGTPMTRDNIEHHEGKSDVTAHRTCFRQVQAHLNEFGAWADGWKPTAPPIESAEPVKP